MPQKIVKGVPLTDDPKSAPKTGDSTELPEAGNSSEHWCNERIMLNDGWVLVCEKAPHQQLDWGDEKDSFNKTAHSGWYQGTEYEWGGIKKLDLTRVHQGYRVDQFNKGSFSVGLLCHRELHKTVIFEDGVASYSGRLVSIKHLIKSKSSPREELTEIVITMGSQSKKLTLDSIAHIRVYQ